LLAIGRLVPYKGFAVLIRALALVKCDCHLDLVVDGPLRLELQELAQVTGVTDRLTFHGSVSETVRERFLSEADILCFPSVTKAEMFGMVQLEAMANGVPVISTEIPGSGTPEVTRNSGGGLVVPIEDANALADAIMLLARDEALYFRLSAAGLKFTSDDARGRRAIQDLLQVCQGGSQMPQSAT
jgi:rhamnosyl/mannosyltransferase